MNQRVLLIVSGGIAAYKALELVRLLRRADHGVTCVLTASGARFVTAVSLQALSESQVYTDLWSLTENSEMGHIQLSRAADLVVVAPASADILARMAAGLADDLATTLLLATDKPVLVAPAMNVRMWEHPATLANMGTLRARGVRVVGPEVGEMACHETGPGRMAEPAAIMAAVAALLDQARAAGQARPAAGAGRRAGRLAGRHAIVTSGPTHEPIDPVRYLANRSSGRQGHAVAAALAEAGARVTLVRGPVAIADPPGVAVVAVETAAQMRAAVLAALPAAVFVGVAAVADWTPETVSTRKMKKGSGMKEGPEMKEGRGAMTLGLRQTEDILAEVAAAGDLRPALVIGFAAETEEVQAQAAAKRVRKGCDWVLGNHAGVMGESQTAVTLVTQAGAEEWQGSKTAVAALLVDRIAGFFQGSGG